MRRTTLFLVLGIFCTALLVDAIAVYLLHDVDHDMMGRLNEAFLQLCFESFLFAAIVGGAAGLLATLGRFILRLRSYSPHGFRDFLLGIGVTIFQYVWEYSARAILPKRADLALSIYMIAAIALCTVVLLHETARQKKVSQAASISS
jgi:hypothetical protein